MALYAVIMAGGRGERFWPVSTAAVPKPFIRLMKSGSTLIQETVNRIKPLIPPERVFISIGEAQQRIAREQLPQVPADNFIIEPVGRDTSACIGFCALHLERMDPEADMLVLPADHFISDIEGYTRTIQKGVDNLPGANAVVFGIAPQRPETGYGYVQAEKPADSNAAWNVRRFVEKPDAVTATEYIRSGDFFWNSGMFLWQVRTLLKLFQEHLPETYKGLDQIRPWLGCKDTADEVTKIFSSLQRISIDFGILEKSSGLRLIPTEFDWDDIGNWAALERLYQSEAGANISIGKHSAVETEGCIVYSEDATIATLGVKDLIIVHSQGKILVCPKDRAGDLKKIVAVLESKA